MSSTTKEELLHEASRMLLSKGLSGFSLQELADQLKLKKASLFHHFPSKNALALALYRLYQESFTTWIEAHAGLHPRRQILAYAQELTRWICIKKRVCPVGALSLEWNHVDPELRAEIKKLHELQRKWLTQNFKRLQQEVGLMVSINDAVLSTMGLLQGSIQLARINEDPALVLRILKSHLAAIQEKK